MTLIKINSRKKKEYNPYEVLFGSFLAGIDILSRHEIQPQNKLDLDIFMRRFEDTNIDPHVVKSWFRSGYKDGLLNFSNFNDGRVIYLSKCLGHHVGKGRFFRFPRLCILYSLKFLKGKRWPEAEEFIVRDDFASYLYARYVMKGRLPEKMHTEIVLRTFLSKSFSIRSYFSEN